MAVAFLQKREQSRTTMTTKWKVEYDNDTGPNDDNYYQFWTISDGNKVFTCYNEEDADWLCKLLNNNEHTKTLQ